MMTRFLLVAFAVAAVGLLLFLYVERRATEPVIGLHLFSTPNFSLATAIGFVAGFAMFGTITFLPQFQQFVQDQWEPGKVTNLDQSLGDLDGKVDQALKLAGG